MQPTYSSLWSQPDAEGLYDEPAFNGTLTKNNPLYESDEHLAQQDGFEGEDTYQDIENSGVYGCRFRFHFITMFSLLHIIYIYIYIYIYMKMRTLKKKSFKVIRKVQLFID